MKTKIQDVQLRLRNPVARDLASPKYRQKVQRNQRRLLELARGRFKSLDLLGI